MLNYAGEAGDSQQQLAIVSRLAVRPRGRISMRMEGANYVIARGWRHTCV